jgi:hypothetical protein
MNLVAHVAGKGAAQGALLFLQAVAIGARLGRREDPDREVKPVPSIA